MLQDKLFGYLPKNIIWDLHFIFIIIIIQLNRTPQNPNNRDTMEESSGYNIIGLALLIKNTFYY